MTVRVRKNKRKQLRYSVSIKVDLRSRDIFFSNYVTNLSNGGLFVRTKKAAPINSEVSLKLRFPASDMTIETTGKVIWTFDIKKGTGCIYPGMGIKFKKLPPEIWSYLERYLKALPVGSKKAK